MSEFEKMGRVSSLRMAGLFFVILEVAMGIMLIILAVINYDIFFSSLLDMERMHLLMFLGVFVPAAAAIAFGICVAIFAQQAWNNEHCRTLLGNYRIPKSFVIIVDALMILFLLTGLWDITISTLYLLDGGGLYDFIPGLVLGPIVMYWQVAWILALGSTKVIIGIILVAYEAHHWIGQDKICEVLFKPE